MTASLPSYAATPDDEITRDPAPGKPDLSVLAGKTSVRVAFERQLSAWGFRVCPEAGIKLLLDVPRAYAMRALESRPLDDPTRFVVVTWSSCPEYVEDLRDLRPEALLSDEFFLRQDSGAALAEVLKRVSGGATYSFTPGPATALTPSERAVLRYAAHGWTNRRISERLCLSEQTVKNRLRHVYKKLGIHNHAEAAVYYWQVSQPD
jgi:DNA-binding NarL/FixJ family response regulator